MFLGKFDTRHFSFVSLGDSEVSAREAMEMGLRKHGSEYDLPPDWFVECFYPDDASFEEVFLGKCLRDGEEIMLSPEKSGEIGNVKTGVFVASLETRSFSFKSFGTSSVSAKSSLKRGLVKHGEQYRLNSNWFMEFGFPDDVSIMKLMLGQCLRDGMHLSSETSSSPKKRAPCN